MTPAARTSNAPFVLVCFVAVLCCAAVTASTVKDAPEALSRIVTENKDVANSVDWSYDHDHGPRTWTGLCNPETPNHSAKQSPINIVTAKAVEEGALAEAVRYHYTPFSQFLVFNQGPQILGTWEKGMAGHVSFAKKDWEAESFVVHAPAEHTINGVRFDLEIQVTHREPNGEKLVISTLVDASKNVTSSGSNLFSKFLANVPADVGLMNDVAGTVSVESLLPTVHDAESQYRPFYAYEGSETVPPCKENVRWIIMQDVVKGDYAKAEKFRQFLGDMNARPIQAINERTVRKSPVARPAAPAYPAPMFEYSGARGPAYWPELSEKCGSETQSPVDIVTTDAEVDHELDTSLQINYVESKVSTHLVDGVVKATFEGDSALDFGGSSYKLRYMEVHTPGEHAIDGHRAQMEVQLVHTTDDGSGKLILAVLYRVRNGHELSPFWKEFSETLPTKLSTQSTPDSPVNPFEVLPDDLGFYTYAGSETAPPCDGSTWVVFKASALVDRKLLDKLTGLANDNARPLQNLNGRKVRQSFSIYEDAAVVQADSSYNPFGDAAGGNGTAVSANATANATEKAHTAPDPKFPNQQTNVVNGLTGDDSSPDDEEQAPELQERAPLSARDTVGNMLQREVSAMTGQLDEHVTAHHGAAVSADLTHIVNNLSRSIGKRNSVMGNFAKDPSGLGVEGVDLPKVPTLNDILNAAVGGDVAAQFRGMMPDGSSPELDEPTPAKPLVSVTEVEDDPSKVPTTVKDSGEVDKHTGVSSKPSRSLYSGTTMEHQGSSTHKKENNPADIVKKETAGALEKETESAESGDFSLMNGDQPDEVVQKAEKAVEDPDSSPNGNLTDAEKAALEKKREEAIADSAAVDTMKKDADIGDSNSNVWVTTHHVSGSTEGPVKEDTTAYNIHLRAKTPDELKGGNPNPPEHLDITYHNHANRAVLENAGDFMPMETHTMEPPIPGGLQSNSASPEDEASKQEDVLLSDLHFDAYIGETTDEKFSSAASKATLTFRGYEDGRCIHMCSATQASELPDTYVLELAVKKNVHAKYTLSSYVSNLDVMHPLVFVSETDGSRSDTGDIPVFGTEEAMSHRIRVHAQCKDGVTGDVPYAIEVKVTAEEESGKAVLYGKRNCQATKSTAAKETIVSDAKRVVESMKQQQQANANQNGQNAATGTHVEAAKGDNVVEIDGGHPKETPPSGHGLPVNPKWDEGAEMPGKYKEIDDVLKELYTNVESTNKREPSKEDAEHIATLKSAIDRINFQMKGVEAIIETIEGAFGKKWEGDGLEGDKEKHDAEVIDRKKQVEANIKAKAEEEAKAKEGAARHPRPSSSILSDLLKKTEPAPQQAAGPAPTPAPASSPALNQPPSQQEIQNKIDSDAAADRDSFITLPSKSNAADKAETDAEMREAAAKAQDMKNEQEEERKEDFQDKKKEEQKAEEDKEDKEREEEEKKEGELKKEDGEAASAKEDDKGTETEGGDKDADATQAAGDSTKVASSTEGSKSATEPNAENNSSDKAATSSAPAEGETAEK